MQSLFPFARPNLGSRFWSFWRGHADEPIRTETDYSNKDSRQPKQWHEEKETAEAEAQREKKEPQCGIACSSALAPTSEQEDDQKDRKPASAPKTRIAT